MRWTASAWSMVFIICMTIFRWWPIPVFKAHGMDIPRGTFIMFWSNDGQIVYIIYQTMLGMEDTHNLGYVAIILFTFATYIVHVILTCLALVGNPQQAGKVFYWCTYICLNYLKQMEFISCISIYSYINILIVKQHPLTFLHYWSYKWQYIHVF